MIVTREDVERGGHIPTASREVSERSLPFEVTQRAPSLQGAFASRMSHSCTPNCQAVVMTSRSRLTIAVYTLRHIQPGEELTFDYSSTTESEKEFRAAVCLCGTTACRGSFLYFAGSKAFMQASVALSYPAPELSDLCVDGD